MRSTLPITTQQNLAEVEHSSTALALTSNNFEVIRSVNSVAAILDRPNITMLKKVVDPTLLELFLATELTRLIDSVNIDQRLSIQGHQVPIIAAQLVEQYPTESLEDFALCFKRGSTGFYGTIYNLDASVINLWMKAYLEEKYTLIEAERSKRKADETEALGKVDYKAFIERKKKEMAEATANEKAAHRRNNEAERFRIEYLEKRKFQQALHRAASEFYAGQDLSGIRVWTDEDSGYDIYAKTEEDANRIYELAKQQP